MRLGLPEPWYRDDHVTFFLGDAEEIVSGMPPGSVDCIVTSPPYWRLRDYAHPAQLGQETTPDAYVQRLRAVFAAAHRVLADHGTLWVNLGDRYATGLPCPATGPAPSGPPNAGRSVGAKNLLGLPWRVAFALQADGWILRNEIIWHKPNAVPESVRDRLSRRHEHLFLFTKNNRYHFELDPVREPYTGDRSLSRRAHRSGNKPHTARGTWPPTPPPPPPPPRSCALGPNLQPTGARHTAAHERGRNPGDVWVLPTRPTRLPHTSPFPPDIPLRCIAAGCLPGGTVLDPFSGIATTALAARQLGRKAVLVDVREDYHCMGLARLDMARRS